MPKTPKERVAEQFRAAAEDAAQTLHSQAEQHTVRTNAAVHRDPELVLITVLCRELVKLGLGVGLSDARPAVVIRTGPGNPALLVTVDATGEFYEWHDAEEQHPVTDPAGAAARVVEYLQAGHVGPQSAS